MHDWHVRHQGKVQLNIIMSQQERISCMQPIIRAHVCDKPAMGTKFKMNGCCLTKKLRRHKQDSFGHGIIWLLCLGLPSAKCRVERSQAVFIWQAGLVLSVGQKSGGIWIQIWMNADRQITCVIYRPIYHTYITIVVNVSWITPRNCSTEMPKTCSG